ncbi:MAG TPA: NADH-quinone oxidoreductase subunit D, partial [Nocardioides sp.]|nr:NADH-quinone oxidoreductase subunit D [Nocardioides sp.]
MTTEQDFYAAPGDTSQGRVFTVTGQDWDSITQSIGESAEERVVVNMGPQHPSTHGVLRLILELSGETVTEARAGIGYLHTGIEKNMEFRTWTQGVTFCTRMDYVAPLFQEAAYCLAVEKLLGITDDVPERATVIRVLMMELNRITSHLVCLATGGNELGATTIMTVGFTAREEILKIFELISGLRMNHAYIRPGGVAQDIPPGAIDTIRESLVVVRGYFKQLEDLMMANPILHLRLKDVGYLGLSGCMALGVTGPVLRSAGLPYDVRKANPYCGYETYDFEVPVAQSADSWGRLVLRVEECYQSMKIVEQTLDRLQKMGPGPVMVADKKVAWPAQMAIGA